MGKRNYKLAKLFLGGSKNLMQHAHQGQEVDLVGQEPWKRANLRNPHEEREPPHVKKGGAKLPSLERQKCGARFDCQWHREPFRHRKDAGLRKPESHNRRNLQKISITAGSETRTKVCQVKRGKAANQRMLGDKFFDCVGAKDQGVRLEQHKFGHNRVCGFIQQMLQPRTDVGQANVEFAEMFADRLHLNHLYL